LGLLNSDDDAKALLFQAGLDNNEVDNVDLGRNLRCVVGVRQTSCDEKAELRVVVNFVCTKFDSEAATVLDQRLVKQIVKGWVKGLANVLK